MIIPIKSSISPIDGTLTSTTTSGQSGPGSNGNEEVLPILKTSSLDPHHQMQFNVISRTHPKYILIIRILSHYRR